MSSAVVSTPAALGRPFVFDEYADEEHCHPERSRKCAKRISRGVEGSLPLADSRLARVTPASRLEIRPAPEMVSSGIPAIDALTGGLPRGCLTEICGPASSGRTTVLLATLAAATRRGEFCVVVDASDALDPQSADAAGVDLERLLWVRCGDEIQQNSHPIKPASPAKGMKSAGAPPLSCTLRQGGGFDFQYPPLDFRQSEAEHRLEQVLRATDLLLESGGFGLIVLDLGDLPPQSARRIPLTTWFRFRRAIEHTPTTLLAIEQQAIAGSCSSLLIHLGSSDPMLPADGSAAERRKITAHGVSRGFIGADGQALEGRKKILSAPIEPDLSCPPHTQLLTGLNITAELIRSRLDRKPARSVAFATKTAWAG